MGGLSVVELTHVEDIPYLSMLCTSVTCVTLYTHRYIIQGLIVLCRVKNFNIGRGYMCLGISIHGSDKYIEMCQTIGNVPPLI